MKQDGGSNEVHQAAAEQHKAESSAKRGKRDNRSGRSRKQTPHASAERQLGALENGETVNAINAELLKQNKSRLKIGEIVDRAIGPKGRADYGASVIAGLAADPGLMCSGECLRKYWHYYRVVQEHGEMLTQEFPTLKYGHVYQISRLMQLEEEFGDDAATQAIMAMARHAMDHGKGGKPMPADALGKAVTTHIRSVKGHGPDAVAEAVKDAEEPDALETAHTALSDSLGTVQEAAERIAGSNQYNHACRLQANIDRISQAHIAILGHIVRHDPQSLAIPMARQRITALAGLVGLSVTEAGIAEGQEVSK